MEKIQFDTGVKEYKLSNGGVLRFNPGDPNLYARFMEVAEKIRAMEADLSQQVRQEDSTAALELLTNVDKQMKQLLSWAFGEGNDMEKALGGVNLLAVATNGERVVTNLFAALQPILVTGAELCAREKTEAAVAKAKARRAGR